MFNDLSVMQSDPNFFLQQQQYLNQFYLANGYINPFYYQMPQLMNQNPNNQNMMMNIGIPPINPELNINSGPSMMNPQQFQQGVDLNQYFNNLSLLQNQRNNNNFDGDDDDMRKDDDNQKDD